MQVTVEFTGLARHILQRKEINVSLVEQTTYMDIVRQLAKDHPQLIGLLINADGETLMSGNVMVINGDLATPAMVMHDHPNPGDRLIIMSLVTGGRL
jgi:hypothetical protein